MKNYLFAMMLLGIFSTSLLAQNGDDTSKKLAKSDQVSALQLFKPNVQKNNRQPIEKPSFVGDYQYVATVESAAPEFLLSHMESLFNTHKDRVAVKDERQSELRFDESEKILLGIDLNFDVGNVLSTNTRITRISKMKNSTYYEGITPENADNYEPENLENIEYYFRYAITYKHHGFTNQVWVSKRGLRSSFQNVQYKIGFRSLAKNKGQANIRIHDQTTKPVERKRVKRVDDVGNRAEIAAYIEANPEKYKKDIEEAIKRGEQRILEIDNAKKKSKEKD